MLALLSAEELRAVTFCQQIVPDNIIAENMIALRVADYAANGEWDPVSLFGFRVGRVRDWIEVRLFDGEVVRVAASGQLTSVNDVGSWRAFRSPEDISHAGRLVREQLERWMRHETPSSKETCLPVLELVQLLRAAHVRGWRACFEDTLYHLRAAMSSLKSAKPYYLHDYDASRITIDELIQAEWDERNGRLLWERTRGELVLSPGEGSTHPLPRVLDLRPTTRITEFR
jgi:hypothetical protein